MKVRMYGVCDNNVCTVRQKKTSFTKNKTLYLSCYGEMMA